LSHWGATVMKNLAWSWMVLLVGCPSDPMSGLRFACDPDGPNTCLAGFVCVRAEEGHSYKGVCVPATAADVAVEQGGADLLADVAGDMADTGIAPRDVLDHGLDGEGTDIEALDLPDAIVDVEVWSDGGLDGELAKDAEPLEEAGSVEDAEVLGEAMPSDPVVGEDVQGGGPEVAPDTTPDEGVCVPEC